jgi:hypothetical protein
MESIDQLDLLWGVKAIADYVGLTERQAGYQIEIGLIPVKKQGRLVVASKANLREHFANAIPTKQGKPVAPAPIAMTPGVSPPRRRDPGRRSKPASSAVPTVTAPPVAPAEQPPGNGR